VRRTVLLLLVLLTASACTEGADAPDAANVSVCRTVQQQRSGLLAALRATPQDAAALDRTLGGLERVLNVRDTDASDQMRGDALVLQINVTTARRDLARGGTAPAGQMDRALTTFVVRECDGVP
jgi:hypothetical protein